LNVGLSKKIGQPDYGSLGASCHVEVELDGALLRDDLETFHTHVKNAFLACRQAVQDELARHQRGTSSNGASHANGHGHADHHDVNGNGSPPNGSSNGDAGRNGNGHSAGHAQGPRRTNPRRATASQVRAIHALANRQGLDLDHELRSRFQVERPDDLTIALASQFIDDLKAAPHGTGERR